MESKFKRPVHLVAFGVFLLVLAGFFTLIHVGTSAHRADRGIAHGFAFRGESGARPGYAEAFIRGGEIVADRAGDFVSEFFSSEGSKAQAGQSYAASGGREEAGGGARDPFEDFYDRNYSGGANVPPSDGYSAGSGGAWGDSGGTMTAAASAAGARPSAGTPRAGNAKAAAAGAKMQSGGVPGKPLFGGPLGKGAAQPAKLQLQASLPMGGSLGKPLERPGEMSGGQFSRGAAQAAGGALSGMRGQAAAADLNGADEGARSSSQGSYNSKMSGGAASAAASGGSAPTASAAAKVSSGDGAAGGSGTASGSGDAGTDTDKKDAGNTKSSPAGDLSFSQSDDGDEKKPFLEAVVIEKRSGKDSRYITAEDKKGELDEGQLKSGAILVEQPKPEGAREKGFRSSHERTAREPDPEEFSALSEERKTELKRRIHGFMKRVEKHYGDMDDITFTSCEQGKEICAQHQLTEGYLTLNTQDEAELLLGLKYVETRWRRYTVGFSLPGWGRPHHKHREKQ